MGISSFCLALFDTQHVFSDPLQSILTLSWPVLSNISRVLLSLTMNRSTGLAWPLHLGPFSPALWPGKEAIGTQRRPCLPLTLSHQTQWPYTATLNLPEKLTLTQYGPRLLRMTADLTAAICFEVSSQVLQLSLWVERRAAQVHNSALVCACRCSHTWLCEGGFMCTFILVHVGRHEGAEFAFSF